MKASELLEYLGVSFVVVLIVAALSFLFKSVNNYFLTRMGGILIKIAAVILGIMLLVWLSELAHSRAKTVAKFIFLKRLLSSVWSRRVLVVCWGAVCGAGIFIYFYPLIASFSWLTWFFAALLVMSFVALQLPLKTT
ncbi:MAG: hypothetical protein QW165_01130 [Candidatus Woesearchaeota archaeon]